MTDLNFQNQVFEKVDGARQAFAKGEYEYCIFRGCDLSNCDLSQSRFLDTEFIDCNLSNAVISNTSFQQVVFNNCKLLGLQFDQCSGFGFAASFNNCQLNHSTFYKMKLSGSGFTNCSLVETDFTDAELKKVLLQHCDLHLAIFENTNLEGADIRSSINYIINPETNRIKGAQFSLPDVIGLLSHYNIQID